MTMTIERLEQFRHLANEVEILENRIISLHKRPDYFVSDTVKGSSAMNLQQHIIVISGYGGEHIAKIKAIENLYSKRQKRLIEELEAIETFIESLQDSELRQIIELRYIKGDRWNKVAGCVCGYPSGDTARKKVARFFEK